LDANLQQQLVRLLQRSENGAELMAATIIDNSNGEIVAYLGGTERQNQDGLLVPVSLPQWLLPLTYGIALERGELETTQALANGEQTWVTVRRAVSEALPLPYQELLNQLPSSTTLLAERLNPLHWQGDAVDNKMELTLLQWTGLYRALLQGGSYLEPYIQRLDIPEAISVLQPETSFVLNEFLLPRRETDHFPLWGFRLHEGRDHNEAFAVAWSERNTVGLWLRRPRAMIMTTATVRALLPTLMPNTVTPHRPPAGVVQLNLAGDELLPPRREWVLPFRDRSVSP
jgi:hypothetical protein